MPHSSSPAFCTLETGCVVDQAQLLVTASKGFAALKRSVFAMLPQQAHGWTAVTVVAVRMTVHLVADGGTPNQHLHIVSGHIGPYS